MRTLVLCALLLLLCTCDRAQNDRNKQDLVTIVNGTLRYQEVGQILEATVRVSPTDTTVNAPTPTLFGTAMPRLRLAGNGVFRERRSLPLPPQISLTVPCKKTDCPLGIDFSPPFIDSIAPVVSKQKTLSIPVAAVGLSKHESLVVFFEPKDRHSAPERIQLVGPTSTGTLTLPKKTLANIPAGAYDVYLIKQQLRQDSSAFVRSSLQMEYFTKSVDVSLRD
ncbi:MAG: hypothetical protein AAGA31_19305 [Bacteroidota bacterium]